MTTAKKKRFSFKSFKLAHGSHKSFEQGACAMELVAYMAGEKHSDSPECACPVISSYVRRLNDRFDDAERQLLKPYLKRIIGTKDGNALKRSKILAHAALTVFAAKAMDAAKLPEQAANLRACVFGEWAKNREIALTARKAAAAYAAYAAYAAAAYAAYAAYAAADAAYADADAAAYAAYAAADAAAYAAYADADAAADAAYAAADADAYAADAAAYAAYADADAAAYADAAAAAYAAAYAADADADAAYADADAAAYAAYAADAVKHGAVSAEAKSAARAEIVQESLRLLDEVLNVK